MKGQSSIELVTYLAIGILITILFLLVLQPYERDIITERKAILAKEMLWRVTAELNGAASVGDGYSRLFTLPNSLSDGTNYSIRIDSEYQVVQIFWGDSEGAYGLPIATSNVTGSFVIGVNRITNSDGLITVEAA
ncbi:hypothetical protein DRN67_03230 [Candidatus Micrarchaeota archaeon]|nr:MAG: hypothetical protein DRN67_03230 [Candidatus Micrarchaeota archaeon]